MARHQRTARSLLLGATALAGALALSTGSAAAQQREYSFDLPAQPLDIALRTYARTAEQQVIFAGPDVLGRTSAPVSGRYSAEEALQIMLAGSDLTVRHTAEGVLQVARAAQDPQGGSAAGGGAEVEALIVTAQKREEAIQDVPIAISAFSQKALEEQKIEGGFDLLKAIPNVTFSKSNFSGYNFSIRGVGTKAISATTDPGVAVAFNNTALIHNRLFEQEYFDVERVEVLRGPQGTLYGRNATSGVINVISAKPRLNAFEASLKGEVGNYDAKRLVGMVNIPVIDDVLAIRLAGAGTQRSGYDFNEITGNNINGRVLWSGRLTIGFEPTDRIRADLIWEHFEEDDNRLRTGKQLCHRDEGLTTVGNESVFQSSAFDQAFVEKMHPALFSQGCKPGSLYDEGAFDTPNGLALPFVFAPLYLGAPGQGTSLGAIGFIDGVYTPLIKFQDPYGGLQQSRDLRTIASIRDPVYRAKADILELNVDIDLTDSLSFTSQTAYVEDEVYSFQDFNRFNSFPMFVDTSYPNLTRGASGSSSLQPSQYADLAPGGVFCDPQLGCTDRMAGFDISQAVSTQFNQEFRVQSNFDGPLNFSIGANYTKFETLNDYYVMINLLSALALTWPFYEPRNNGIDLSICHESLGYLPGIVAGGGPVPAGDPTAICPYIDPNPAESINGEGHNYFRSKNPYELESLAGFGEIYWNATDALKLTAGLRFTQDEKRFTPVPSQTLLAPGYIGGGVVSRGYPEKDPIVQEWGEWTGRIGLDWKPELSFTDQTLLYAFYSRGYKGGGANPPTPGYATLEETIAFFILSGNTPQQIEATIANGVLPVSTLVGVEYGPTFEPEFVDAIELGAKNTLLDGAATFNATAFYYDYKDYQISQIRDRTAVNENFDAKIWGLEFEAVFAPSRDFRINANVGYLDTQIADGESSIDLMNRTQGHPGFVVTKPWVTLPSNCVVPVGAVEDWLTRRPQGVWGEMCGALGGVLGNTPPPTDPATGLPYDPLYYDGTDGRPNINGGAGIRDDLGGNELPNAPHITTNIGAQYGRDILDGTWRVTMRGDAYWQSQSWARVYNAVNDKLHGWYNLNVSVRLENEDLGVEAEFYVKNLLDKSPITDAFLNSDDSGLTTNVFVLDPRLVGFSLRKTF